MTSDEYEASSNEYRQSLEFLNQNMHRNYPVQDTCVVQTADGIYLPSSFIVDCQLLIPCSPDQQAGIDTSRFFISAVNRYTNSFQILIGYQPEGGEAFACACSTAIVIVDGGIYPMSVPLTAASGIPDNELYAPLLGLSGTLWIGTMANMTDLGSLSFTYATAALNSTCIVKTLTSTVTNLTVVDATGATVAELTGGVTLQMDESIELSYDSSTGTLQIGVAEEWLQTQLRNIVNSAAGAAIKTINGQSPDTEGNFVIAGLDCVSIKEVQDTNSITVSNPCSKPCCSDDSGDLADIRSSQDLLTDKVDRISENLNSFINSINNVETRLPSLVASRK